MSDYRELPPIDFDDYVSLGVEVAEENVPAPELPRECSECEELSYTYRVTIPSICSHCLQAHSMPSGAQVVRNTHDMSEFVKSSPPGYHWDWTTQSHVPDRKPETVTVTPGNVYTVTVGGGGQGSTYAKGGSGGGGSGGGSSFHESGSYSYSPLREDPRNWSPAQISSYLQKNYSPDELRERYSELRNELLYGTPGTYKFHEPETEDPSIHYPKSHLTGRGESAILNENALNPDTEETDMPMEHILSRDEADAAYKQAAAALARLDDLERKYSPDLPNGSVIAFGLTFPSRPGQYSYAAVKAAGLWFPTGKVHPSYPVGTGIEWTTLLSGLEQFQATDFVVLRTGGEAQELEPGRTVVLPPGSVTTAFDGGPDDEDETEDDLADRTSGKYPEGS